MSFLPEIPFLYGAELAEFAVVDLHVVVHGVYVDLEQALLLRLVVADRAGVDLLA